MATDSEIDELKRMCTVLFLELQEVRRRLDIEPLDLQESDKTRVRHARDLRRFEEQLRRVSGPDAGSRSASTLSKGS